jgi:hypothetical protein
MGQYFSSMPVKKTPPVSSYSPTASYSASRDGESSKRGLIGLGVVVAVGAAAGLYYLHRQYKAEVESNKAKREAKKKRSGGQRRTRTQGEVSDRGSDSVTTRGKPEGKKAKASRNAVVEREREAFSKDNLVQFLREMNIVTKQVILQLSQIKEQVQAGGGGGQVSQEQLNMYLAQQFNGVMHTTQQKLFEKYNITEEQFLQVLLVHEDDPAVKMALVERQVLDQRITVLGFDSSQGMEEERKRLAATLPPELTKERTLELFGILLDRTATAMEAFIKELKEKDPKGKDAHQKQLKAKAFSMAEDARIAVMQEHGVDDTHFNNALHVYSGDQEWREKFEELQERHKTRIEQLQKSAK